MSARLGRLGRHEPGSQFMGGRHLGASLLVLTWLVVCVCLRVCHCLSRGIADPTRGRDHVCFPVFLALSLGPYLLFEHSVKSQ